MNENELIESAYAELKRIGLVQHRSEFVTQWLGREESYLRVLRHKRRGPSAAAIRNCCVRITTCASQLAQSPHRALKQVGVDLCALGKRLGSACH
ncbi:MAG: hypothetical protein LAT81_12420 [Oceanicaulis sp.]|nr:hypothetical protein [Oceanicaulis sp.]